MLHGVPGFFPQTTTPVRVVGREDKGILIDINHPLASFPLVVSAEVLDVLPHETERGGSCSACDYWILKIDSEYRYAIVGAPSRKYLWILSRTPTMSSELRQELFKEIAALDFDPKKLILTEQ